MTIIRGEDLQRLGARDLASALMLAGGVTGSPGGDEGPAGMVPEMWGLREVDAFLLIVDGVPWGGAFNPPTTAIDLSDIDRIEIVRGSAPVVYGATAFSGVIQVIRRHGGPASAEVSAGSYGSASLAVRTPLSGSQLLSANVERQRFRDDRSGVDRGHFLYRGEHQTGSGRWRFDLDALRLVQDPSSPRPREGTTLSPRVPIDANHNPSDGHIDTSRFQGTAGYDTLIGGMPWTTTLSITRSTNDLVRGFVTDLDAAGENAEGFGQRRRIMDYYFDSHLTRQLGGLRLLAGIDYLGGSAKAASRIFGYSIALNGGGAPDSASLATDERTSLRDRRNFSAVYAQGEWSPSVAWHVDAGVRLNHASETRRTTDPDGADGDDRTNNRLSTFLGLSHRIVADAWLFADYRNTFKPAAIDFGPDAEPDILEPETSQSYELGLKGHQAHDRLFWQASAFLMNVENILIAEGGSLPGFENGGRQRFRGLDLETQYSVNDALRVVASYGRHDARFRDFVQELDGVPTQLSGKRLEMSAKELASLAAIIGLRPWHGSISLNYVGPRYLNRRNTALAGGYVTADAGIGYHAGWGELRLDGRNLTDRRDPAVESELGDAQYYLLQPRSFRVTYRRMF